MASVTHRFKHDEQEGGVMDTPVQLRERLVHVYTPSMWTPLVRHIGIGVMVVGVVSLFLDRGADIAWSLLLVIVGALATRVAAPAGLAMFAVTLGWTTLAGGLLGRWLVAAAAAALAVAALLALQAAWRQAQRPLPAIPGLAVGSLAVGLLSTLILIAALGSSLVAFVTGWPISAQFVDSLASIGAQAAVLAVALAAAGLVQRGRHVWTAPLGGIAGLVGLLAYVSLLLFAQG